MKIYVLVDKEINEALAVSEKKERIKKKHELFSTVLHESRLKVYEIKECEVKKWTI